MPIWIGVDDTDSLQGQCTTFLVTELIRDLIREYDLIGFPRLVRLNPNIPWKTRGNGALCIRVGRGRGVPFAVGRIEERDVLAYPSGDRDSPLEDVEKRTAAVVEQWSCLNDPSTEPGFAVLRRPAPPRLYWRGVRGVLPRSEVLQAVRHLGRVRGYNGGRGMIGAIAATAWRPRDRTYEVLAYRHQSRWGTRRLIDPESVVEMDGVVRSSFNNFDYSNRRVVVAPRSPCPVLLGIRGDEPRELPQALRMIRGESPDRWLIFETNQGTDDHVVKSTKPEPYQTISFLGYVTRPPRSIPGGHVVFSVDARDVTAYEPSKQFRSVVRGLIPGDKVRIVGALRKVPRTVNLEKLEVLTLAEDRRKVSNPLCRPCGRRAKSAGRGLGYRCPRCGRRFSPAAATHLSVARLVTTGWHEPPVGSRRHLSMPLKRMIVAQLPPSLPRALNESRELTRVRRSLSELQVRESGNVAPHTPRPSKGAP